MSIDNIWRKGWLKDKVFCYNHSHFLYNPPIDHITRHLNRGQNVIIILVGTPRSGKSWASMWLQCYFNWCYYGREEYKPEKDNVNPLKDMYWKIDDFMNATKKSDNWNKFITLEEQGAENSKFDWYNKDSQNYDKLCQIFGVDNTNLIINLPYIFDLNKGTRLKGHFLFSFKKRSKTKVNAIFCKRWMSDTTEKAKFVRVCTWANFPNIYNKYPALVDEYEKLKREYNAKKKEELTRGSGGFNTPKIFGRIPT